MALIGQQGIELELAGGGGVFIPLAGTEVGKPVTGLIEISNDGTVFGAKNNSLIFGSGNDVDVYNNATTSALIQMLGEDIGTNSAFISLSATNDVTGEATLTLGSNELSVPTFNIAGSGAFKGLTGSADYSPNYDNYTYTQKIYVDTAIATAVGNNGGLVGEVVATDNISAGTTLGYSAVVSAQNNIAVGVGTPFNLLTTGDYNIAVGNNVLTNTTTGYNNIVMGDNVFPNLSTAYNCVGIGQNLYTNFTDGGVGLKSSIAIGANMATWSQRQSIMIGYNSYQTAVDELVAEAGAAYDNISIGWYNLRWLENGYDNIAVGYSTLEYLENGNKNNAFGEFGLSLLETGNGNNSLGWYAGAKIANGDDNIVIGDHTDNLMSYGTYNDCIFIGANVDTTAAGLTNAIAIGTDVIISASNTAVIGKSGTKLAIARATATESIHTDGGIIIGAAASTTDGTIQYTGTDIEGRVGGAWKSLTTNVAVADDFANDAAAAIGGIAVGGLYHTSGTVKIRLT